jgi:hypothetical protein
MVREISGSYSCKHEDEWHLTCYTKLYGATSQKIVISIHSKYLYLITIALRVSFCPVRHMLDFFSLYPTKLHTCKVFHKYYCF